MKTTTFLLSTLGLSASLSQASDFSLDLNAHLNMTLGKGSVHESNFATHAHDPNSRFTVQGLELSASARYGEYLAGFVSVNSFIDQEDKVDAELEEAFLKLENLPGGFEVRGGRMLARVGTQNNQHIHSWHFVDANLITTRFLGDEGLVSEGAELSYWLPFEHKSLLTIGYSNAVAHQHEHEEEEDHGGGHHDEHVEGEGALLNDEIFNLRLKGIYQITDFRSVTYGASYLNGKNGYGKRGHIVGADTTYLWRENGIEAGGKHLRAIVEPIYRNFDYQNEDGDVSGSASEWGIHTSVGYGFIDKWEAGLRYDYTQGVDEPVEELGKRHRISAAVTRTFELHELLSGHTRLQYTHDRFESQNENAIWLQVQFDLGTGGEIR